ncbi:ImmA/IrrE family metallo-endopeptidase [Geomicrobium sediminis]|uniref:Zn-dependent peptidase ImmA (M78 family) n=1 Tax=Geomicrobium sediminis TaxID=1347788 RepID=A0ABS2PGG8_9BACL|nr:ImmA/IrrE family metallo-endopeptidase [Geomicrobium sediminis]MBM7634436.1 Zn-dependent peptidase ImmA (M78 family) [Geomicrobium sediminis]
MIISHYQTNNVYELCDYLHIKILKNDLGQATGVLHYYNAMPLIHINSKANYKDYYIAYILGYFFFNFNPDHSVLFDRLNDEKSNVFASELLLTDELLFTDLNTIKSLTIEEIANFFNLPIHAIRIKMNGVPNSKVIFSYL